MTLSARSTFAAAFIAGAAFIGSAGLPQKSGMGIQQHCEGVADKSELHTSQGRFRAQASAGRKTITRSPAGNIRFDVGPGDVWDGDIQNQHGAERAELREISTVAIGEAAWISFSQRILSLSQRHPRNFVVLGQLHGPNQKEWRGKGHFGPPPVALVVHGAKFRILSRYGKEGQPTRQRVQFEAPLNEIAGQWHDYVIHLRLGGDDVGMLDIWRDGAPIVHYRGPLGYDVASGQHYWKFGIYRARAKSYDTVDYANIRFSRRSLAKLIDDPDPISDDLIGGDCE